jgi:hypothetical protein
MEASEFKVLFGDVARAHGFTAAHGGWYRKTPTALFVLNLQKSNFGNYYELNLKLFLGEGLPTSATVSKKLVKSLSGDIFRRQPKECREVFDLDATITADDRRERLDRMFTELVDRIATAAASPLGLLRLRDEGVVYLLPMAEARLKTG